MDVVVRAVNQRFVDEVVFPVFTRGARDNRAALLNRLHAEVDDVEIRMQVEALLDRSGDGGWSEVETDRWQDVVYRLLFSDWERSPTGWVIGGQEEAFAAKLDEGVHTALMISDPLYPYWVPAEAARQRQQLLMPPSWSADSPDSSAESGSRARRSRRARCSPRGGRTSTGPRRRWRFRIGAIAAVTSWRSGARSSRS